MSSETRRPWSIEEDQAIQLIVKQLGTKRWSDISQVMQERFKLLGRSGKQCRQRWHNHLAPEVNKKPWSKQQQEILFQAHKKYGNKWTEISKLIDGRTDNAIKNHFYSSIRRSLRRINKILGSKNSTVKMRNIKPAVLSAIFNIADRDQKQDKNTKDYKDLTLALIEFSRNRVGKEHSIISQQEKVGLEVLIRKLMEFNDLYQKEKRVGNSNGKTIFGSQNSKINEDINSGDWKKGSEDDDEELDAEDDKEGIEGQNYQGVKSDESNDRLDHQQNQNPEAGSIMGQSCSDYETTGKKINLQKSQYDWQQFQQRCETIVNRFLISQCSLKSMDNLIPEQANLSQISETTHKSYTTPLKSQYYSSNQVMQMESVKKIRKI